ncbi:hypothetical protein PHJA_002074200 [Phtheirospermum japonicum]|uniref:Uncharacterized protein n=1 Tax=Phtheirospermum japonicum TaxID=374723 RepID=A0A830C9A1_9LAMI|nr:hypothetical protein PHJA_001402500 [Phtheirospermum japonicum]GFP99301.1 hypothetical protein PHJA_002074200 [Phtheirospermum japonicum]
MDLRHFFQQRRGVIRRHRDAGASHLHHDSRKGSVSREGADVSRGWQEMARCDPR